MALKTTVAYYETFPLLGQERWQKLPLETEIELGIDLSTATDEEIEIAMQKIRKVQYLLKKRVSDFFFESNKAAEKTNTNAVEKVVGDVLKPEPDIIILKKYDNAVKSGDEKTKKEIEDNYNIL